MMGLQDTIMYVNPFECTPFFLNAESHMATSPKRLLLLTSFAFRLDHVIFLAIDTICISLCALFSKSDVYIVQIP